MAIADAPTLHQWRQWGFDPRLPVGKFNQRAPFKDACGDCGRPKAEHPMDRRLWTMHTRLAQLRGLDVPEEAIRPIEEWAERNLVGWPMDPTTLALPATGVSDQVQGQTRA